MTALAAPTGVKRTATIAGLEADGELQGQPAKKKIRVEPETTNVVFCEAQALLPPGVRRLVWEYFGYDNLDLEHLEDPTSAGNPERVTDYFLQKWRGDPSLHQFTLTVPVTLSKQAQVFRIFSSIHDLTRHSTIRNYVFRRFQTERSIGEVSFIVEISRKRKLLERFDNSLLFLFGKIASQLKPAKDFLLQEEGFRDLPGNEKAARIRKWMSENVELLKGVEKLKLDDRRELKLFTLIPPEIGFLTGLRYLEICGTELSYLPQSLRNLVNLEALEIYVTSIHVLPDFFGELPKLRSFELRMSKLTFVPPSLCEHPTLQELNLSHNNLAGEADFSKCSRLKSLNYSGNSNIPDARLVQISKQLKGCKLICA
ncbi:MAG: hypothetical protein HYX48_04445 [Chlamydiales bacterium]|nr:hypothetical protein [Chlamydiales bacterium]